MAITAAQLSVAISVQNADQAKNDLSSIGASADNVSGGFGNMLKQGLANAAGFAVFNLGAKALNFLQSQLTDTIQVAIQHQNIMAQTAQAIKSTGDASGLSAQAINNFATSLSQLTPFSDDVVQGGENLLLTFTGIGKNVFPLATKTMLDMSQAMGQDVKSSAIQLGKALNDPAQGLTALTRVGVTFSDSQKEAIKQMVATGNIAGAQKIMLAELQREFGGSAEAAGKTFGGQLAILQNKLEETKQKVGAAMMPALQQLMAAFDNPATITFITNLGVGLAGALTKAVTGIQNIVAVGTSLVNFFKNNQVAGDLLISVLAGIGAGALVFAATAIPALVASFISWAVAAGAAAIATLAAAAPFIAIGAIVVAVVFGIIEAVQHWGQIVDWLKGVWGGISSWFSGILNGVKVWFTWLWTTIQGDTFKFWQAINAGVKAALQLLVAIIMGPIYAIVDGFIWLYNHNYYFKDLVDSIVNIFKAGLAWVQNAWETVISWLTGLWQGVVSVASRVWGAVSGAVMAVVNTVIGWLKSVWDTEIRGLEIIWNTLSGYAQTAWNAVVGVFQSVWGTISGVLGGLWNNISSWFGNLATKALDWGKNLIQGFINGITGMISNVGNAIGGVADKVKSFLGFHSPTKEGPGQEADTWAPNFVNMFASGLESGIPKIQSIVAQLAKPIQMSLSPIANPSLMAMPAGATAIPSSVGNGQQPIIINIPQNPVNLDGRLVSKAILPTLTNQIRYGVGIKNL